MMKKNKFLYSLLIISVVSVILVGCKDDSTPPPTSPAVDGTTKIEIISPDHDSTVNFNTGTLTWDEPSGVDIAVAIFSSSPDTSSGSIDMTNVIAGTRTGLSGLNEGSVSINALYDYDTGSGDFDDADTIATGDLTNGNGNTHYWVVFAYQSGTILTHSSPVYEVKISW